MESSFVFIIATSVIIANANSEYLPIAPDGSSFRSDYMFDMQANGWLKVHKMPSTWEEARDVCYQEGARLASPINEALYSAMRMALHENKSRYIHTGVYSMATSQDYYSQEGVHLMEMPIKWAEGEPNNYENSQRCLAMAATNGEMSDGNCSDVKPFICYKEKTGIMTMNECGNYDKAYERDGRTGSCYKFYSTPMSWTRAHTVCTADGGHLAIINSDEEAQILREVAAEAKYEVFIGVFNWHNDAVKDHYITLDDKTTKEAGYNDWRESEPNNANGGEHCGTFLKQGTSRPVVLNDYSCSTPAPFICEIGKPRVPVW